MHLYYQLKGGKEAWRAIEDTPDNRKMVADQSAVFIAALSISSTTETDYEKLKYKGDLYFDIDSSDLTSSIKTAQQLVKKLRDLEVSDFSVYLSGKKGFHLTVPAKVFSKGGQVKYLPYVYGKMAEKLEVAGLDFAVYSGGRGRLWRQENVLRKEIGTFKVQIHPDRLPTLTEEKYRVLVSSPAPTLPQTKDVKKSLELSEMYEYCKVAVVEEEKKKSKFQFESMPELEDLKEVPGCINVLVTKGDEKQGSNFNKAAMQLAGYVKSANLKKETISQLINTMAENTKSGTYNTAQKRAHHIKSQVNRAKHDPRMGFAPSYLFSTIEPCGSCILCDGTLDKYTKTEKDEESEIANSPIFEAEGRYWVRMGKADRAISTFVLDPIAYSEVYDPNTNIPERESTTIRVKYDYLGAQKEYIRNVSERSWDSVQALKRSLSGIDNIAFLGSESDLANLKHHVFSRDSEMGRITKTKSCGISSFKIHATGKTCLVYVEPGNSINQFGEPGTHEVYQNTQSPPRVFVDDVKELDCDNALHVKLAKEITKINDPVKMALILGWYVACHFKPHIISIKKQFPLLGLWGNAGSGKSKTASIMSYLHGCDFEGTDSVVSCGGSTPWSLRAYIATSTSTPRIIDEVNKSKLKRHYSEVVDMLKGCFEDQVNTKGSIGGRGDGAEVAVTKLSGPVVMLSEQLPEDEHALIQRSITVRMSRKAREGCNEPWDFVYDNRHGLSSIARALVLTSLKTPKRTIKHWMDAYVDQLPSEKEMDSRPHWCFRVVLAGLKMYELSMASYGVDVTKEVEHLIGSLLNYLNQSQEAIAQVKTRSVVDDVIDSLADMAVIASKNPTDRTGMVKDSSYLRDAETLWIDAEGIYGAYKRYARSAGESAIVGSYRQFRTLLGEEPYFKGDELCPLSEARTCIRLDIAGMTKKGISVNLFEWEM